MRKNIEGQTWREPGTQSLEPHDNGRGNENADGHEVDCDQRKCVYCYPVLYRKIEVVRLQLFTKENRG